MSRVALIGARGQLGVDLLKTLGASYDVVPLTQDEVHVQDIDSVLACMRRHEPRVIVNCSAFHRVDDCETDVASTLAVNVTGVRNLAVAARELDAALVSFSSDYVFDSSSRKPYTEEDLPCPKCVYGASKVAGEVMVAASWSKYFMIRTCGLYGYAGSREKKSNFVELMINLARQGKPLRVVNDQVCTPTSTEELSRATANLLQTDAYGLYHLTAGGQCSWYEFASAIFELSGLNPDLTPVPTSEFPTRAKRPEYSVLDNQRYRGLGFGDLRPWREALQTYLEGRTKNGRI